MQDVTVIEAGRRERHYWLDLWRYRELFRVLAWRDLSVRYKQTVIGVLWALIRPFLTMLVFTVIFGQIVGFRWCILGGQSKLYFPGLAMSIGVSAFFVWFGIQRFRKMENSFADLI